MLPFGLFKTLAYIMGASDSKNIPKTIDTAGSVNNNVIISDTVNVHNNEIVTMLYVIAAVKVLELIYILYKTHNKSQKRKYLTRGMALQNVNV